MREQKERKGEEQMRKTLQFTLSSGMDSFLRVVGLLRRKGIMADDIFLQGNLLQLSVAEEECMNAVYNISKLADVKVCA